MNRIVGGERLVGSLAGLEPLAQTIFGGQRRPGWLARKLERECIDPRACSLLLTSPVDANELVEVERVAGYVLVGRPPSLADLARGAGVGLLGSLRGRGLGLELIRASCELLASQGATALEFLAEPERVAWYARQGFEAIRCEWALQATATGERDQFDWTESEVALTQPAACVWSWIAEVWPRTPAGERGRLVGLVDGQPLRAWVSREGQAVLVQRLELGEPGRDREPAAIVGALDYLRTCSPRGTPVLLYPCPAQQPWSRALVEAGWTIAQRSWVVRRGLVGLRVESAIAGQSLKAAG